MHTTHFFSGTSGLVLPVKNKAAFPVEYRQGSRLRYFSSVFNSIEINSTFKKIPQLKTVQRWSAEVEAGFRFTFKVPESVSHAKELKYARTDLRAFCEAIEQAAQNRGCILLQFPASFTTQHHHQLTMLLSEFAGHAGNWPVAVELRHASWYEPEVIDSITALNASYVIHDFHSLRLDIQDAPRGSLAYMRFHGPEKGYRGSYDNVTLQAYADKIIDWLKRELTVYAYFNNTLGDAVGNLKTLNDAVFGKTKPGNASVE